MRTKGAAVRCRGRTGVKKTTDGISNGGRSVEPPTEALLSISEYIRLADQSHSQSMLRESLLADDLENVLRDDICMYYTGETALVILEYASSLKPGPELGKVLHFVRRREGYRGPVSKLKDILRAAEPPTALRILDAIISWSPHNAEPLAECIWDRANDPLKYELFTCPDVLAHLLSSRAWRDRALALLPAAHIAISGAIQLVRFLLASCHSREDGEQTFDHLSIHETLPLCGEGSKYDLLLLGLLENRWAMEVFREVRKDKPSLIVGILLLLLWDVRGEQKSVMDTLRAWNGIDSAIDVLGMAATVLRTHKRSFNDLIVAVAQAGMNRVARALINSNPTADIILSLTAKLTAASPSSSAKGASNGWALDLLLSLSSLCLYRHIGILKIVLDYLERLTLDQVVQYYRLLLKLASFAGSQYGDGSLRSELLLIFRKQVTSTSPKVRSFGAAAIMAMLQATREELLVGGAEEQEEATCSQAPTKPARDHDDLVSLFESLLLTIVQFRDPAPLEILNRREATVGNLSSLPGDLLSQLNRRVNRVFEKSYIVELDRQEPSLNMLFNLDQDEALIGVTLEVGEGGVDRNGGNFSHGTSPVAPHMLRLLQATEKARHQGALDNVDALLGCPLLVKSVTTGIQVVRNWFVTLINAFYDQEDKEVQQKCLARLRLLQELETRSTVLEDGMPVDSTSGLTESCPRQLNDFLGTLFTASSLALKRDIINGDLSTITDTPIPLDLVVIIKYYLMVSKQQVDLPMQQYLLDKARQCLMSPLALGDRVDDATLASFATSIPCTTGTIDVLLALGSEMHGRGIPLESSNIMSLQQLLMECNYEEITHARLYTLLQILPTSIPRLPLMERALAASLDASVNSVEGARLLSLVLEFDDRRHLLDTVEVIIGKLTTASLGSGGAARARVVYSETFLALTRAPLTANLSALQRAISMTEQLVAYARNHPGGDNTLEECLRHGRTLLERIIREGIPLWEQALRQHRDQVLGTLKGLQQITRSLQILCNHIKGERQLRRLAQRHLPPMRRSLEALIFGVKRLLQANGCLSAFWVGNLKHRSLDGAELVGSQVPLEEDGTESEAEEEKEEEDEEDEKGEEKQMRMDEAGSGIRKRGNNRSVTRTKRGRSSLLPSKGGARGDTYDATSIALSKDTISDSSSDS